jgi:hypothetical protein
MYDYSLNNVVCEIIFVLHSFIQFLLYSHLWKIFSYINMQFIYSVIDKHLLIFSFELLRTGYYEHLCTSLLVSICLLEGRRIMA